MLHWIILALFALPGMGRGAERRPEPLLIAAAADLKFALDELLVEFSKANPGIEAKASYTSSGTLFAQIQNGAPFDLFLSADAKFPRKLIADGKADEASFFQYAIGHLVLWLPTQSVAATKELGAEVLLDPAIRRLAIANPETAPYGAAAVAALKKLGLYDRVRGKLVLGENVAQAAHFAQSGAAEAGIISRSLALSPKMKADGVRWDIPADAYPPIEQAGVICAGTRNRTGAEALRGFLLSAAAGEVLKRHGFSLPTQRE
jgi:molybdate transport system substrate-binding protein